ncbi:hypothetical protein BJX68DRAFT_253672 [Aspergillus pseudodeflectus]|uniref:FAD-binding PCMH-type domain-containing protein n=1 Tax=Aspergillus pseudodeflectus TaxID=176178 RepID=A0ABR4KU62_9EURO
MLCSIPSTPAVLQEICRITCCTALLNSPLATNLIFPSAPRYNDLVNVHYATSAPLQPACFFQPESSDQVGLAISLLAEADGGSSQCQFAIRGGGHAPWKGAAGVDGGVTIDLALMNTTVHNPDTSSVTIMGGAKWGDVYKALQPHGVAVTGGRSDTHGLACANVLDFEVVLSNGQIIGVNDTSHPDLFRALKGGGNNLGIQNRALVTLTSNLVHDLHAQAITIWNYNANSKSMVVASGLQHTRGVGDSAIFREFLDIPQIFSTLRRTDIYDLMMETAPPPGKRTMFLTLTFRNNVRVLEYLRTLHDESIGAATPRAESSDWDFITFLQPFPSVLGNASRREENILGLDRMEGNHILFLLFLAWENYSERVGAGSDYIYMNYAGRDQNPLRGYSEENAQHLKAIARKYDPTGVFQTQCPGGWKVSSA